MVLAESTWQEIDAFSRDAVVLIPTGAVEQHGPHLPLVTDTLIVEAVVRGAEKNLPTTVLLTPTIWLGASSSHLGFAGSLSATYDSYISTLAAVIENLQSHRFTKFAVVNGHGGNSDPNRIALRMAKDKNPNLLLAHVTYFEMIAEETGQLLQGPSKRMTHGDEAETSLILHLRPELVKRDKYRKDGMRPEPPIQGLISRFEELSEEGAIGYPGYATAETGVKLLEAAIAKVTVQLSRMSQTLVMTEI